MIEKQAFGRLSDGREVSRYRLKNNNDLSVDLLDLGCIVQSIKVPDGHGKNVDVVLGYDTAAEYEKNDGYLGAVVGRWANRISGAAFELNGRRWPLAANDGINHLHGGPGGFHSKFWQAEESGDNEITFSRLSTDGEEGYPGNLQVRVTYRLDADEDEVTMSLWAKSDQDTVVNLTNHTYFNLNGQGDILNHQLKLEADYVSQVDQSLIPTGVLLAVHGGAFDFHRFKVIGRDIGADDPQIKNGRGYDHNFVIKEPGSFFAEVRSPQNGLSLRLFTTLPGVQFYTANALSQRIGKGGRSYGPHSGFCLETQYFPDALNQSKDQSLILRKGQTYEHRTVYRFAAERAEK